MPNKSLLHPAAGRAVPRDFVAIGRAERTARFVRGTLWKEHAKTNIVSEGTTIRQPAGQLGLWVILFENVAEGQGYVLEIRDQNHATDFPGIRVRREDEDQVTITFPQVTDNDLCNEFVAYGTATLPSNVTGTLTPMVGGAPSGDPVIDGTTIQQPTARNAWLILFTDVPDTDAANKTYELVVSNTNGQSASSPGLRVDDNACGAPP